VFGDLCRRVVRTRLDPKIENPELRTFKGNPVATVLADRGAYIAAALTVCRAYIVAGRPHLAPRLASFEGWSDTVRSGLIWLGKQDPISSMGASRAEDPGRTLLRALLTAWVHAFGTGKANSVTAKQVILHLTRLDVPVLELRELCAAVHAVAGGDGRTPDPVTLGQWLGRHKNRIVEGMWFAQDTSPKDAIKWYVDTYSPDDLYQFYVDGWWAFVHFRQFSAAGGASRWAAAGETCHENASRIPPSVRGKLRISRSSREAARHQRLRLLDGSLVGMRRLAVIGQLFSASYGKIWCKRSI
jgi:hypothetical protein